MTAASVGGGGVVRQINGKWTSIGKPSLFCHKSARPVAWLNANVCNMWIK